MKLGLNEIFAVIDKVKCADLKGFEYCDVDMKIKIRNTCGKDASGTDADGKEVKGTEAKGAEIYGKEAGKEKQFSGRTECVSLEEGKISCIGSTEEISFVNSPMVGTFYAAPSEGAEPFVSEGDCVKKGQVIGIVEAMKLMNEIKADVDGVVEEILVENESLVEFAQPVLKIRKQK